MSNFRDNWHAHLNSTILGVVGDNVIYMGARIEAVFSYEDSSDYMEGVAESHNGIAWLEVGTLDVTLPHQGDTVFAVGRKWVVIDVPVLPSAEVWSLRLREVHCD